MFPYRHKGLTHELFHLFEMYAVDAAQQLDVFSRKLEGRQLEPQSARRVGQHKAKVDMYNMAMRVNQDVAIVSVFILKEIRCRDQRRKVYLSFTCSR